MTSNDKKYILLDVDEVLLKWIDSFRQYLIASHKFKLKNIPWDWSLTDWLKCDEAEVRRLVHLFNHTSKEFGRLEPCDGAIDGIKSLISMGFTLVAITSCSSRARTISRRVKNLQDIFGDIFEDIICLELGASKTDYLKQYPRGSIWIEDNHKNAVEGLFCGHRPILLDRPHNRKFKNPWVFRCKTWEDIVEAIETYGVFQKT